jgi:hypothetical protein
VDLEQEPPKLLPLGVRERLQDLLERFGHIRNARAIARSPRGGRFHTELPSIARIAPPSYHSLLFQFVDEARNPSGVLSERVREIALRARPFLREEREDAPRMQRFAVRFEALRQGRESERRVRAMS